MTLTTTSRAFTPGDSPQPDKTLTCIFSRAGACGGGGWTRDCSSLPPSPRIPLVAVVSAAETSWAVAAASADGAATDIPVEGALPRNAEEKNVS